MTRRTTRYFGENDKQALLDAIEFCRGATIRASTVAPIAEDVYKGCTTLIAALDEMTGVLTGDKTRFWAKPHTAGR